MFVQDKKVKDTSSHEEAACDLREGNQVIDY
jgi:hypothetical protein